jgi:putative tricarboxylic transport membrane protein
MKITNGKDFWAGLMFISFGIGFMVVSQNYPMGTAVRMGPAYFPTVLGGMLAVLGGVVFFRAFVSKLDEPLRVFPFRVAPLVAGLVLGVIAFYTQTTRESGTVWEVAHMILSGISIVLLFAAFGPKALWVILAAVVMFGYLLKPLGLVIATFVLIVISAAGGHEFKLKEVTILSVILAIFSVYAFVKGLGLPMNIWPSFLE